MDMGLAILEWRKGEKIFVGGVVAAIMIVSAGQLATSQAKTRDAQRKSDVELVARGLTSYYNDYKTYPPGTSDGKIVACGSRGLEVCEWGEGTLVDEKDVAYVKKLPKDPYWERGRTYIYDVRPDRRDYRIYVALEYKRDAQWKPDLTIGCGSHVQCNWYVGH